MDFRMQDRMELKALVDFYATESDKNNQDCYVEIFRPDIKLDVYIDSIQNLFPLHSVSSFLKRICFVVNVA